MTRAAIAFQDVTLGYERHPAVHHLDGFVAPGSLLAIVGPNGGGKSTLLKGIAGAIRPMDGRIDIAGARRHHIAYLPQQIDIDRSFPITVFDAVAMGLWHQIGTWRGLDRGLNLAVLEALATLGLGFLPEGTPLPVARGCVECEGQGFRGRTVLFELLVATEEVKRAIIEGASMAALAAAARRSGLRPMA